MAPKRQPKKGHQQQQTTHTQTPIQTQQSKTPKKTCDSSEMGHEEALVEAKAVFKRTMTAVDSANTRNEELKLMIKEARVIHERLEDLHLFNAERNAAEVKHYELKGYQLTTDENGGSIMMPLPKPAGPLTAGVSACLAGADLLAPQDLIPSFPSTPPKTKLCSAEQSRIMIEDYKKALSFSEEIPDMHILYEIIMARKYEAGFADGGWEAAYDQSMHTLEALVPEEGLWNPEDAKLQTPKNYKYALAAAIKIDMQTRPNGQLRGRARKLARDKAKKGGNSATASNRKESWVPPPHWPAASSSGRNALLLSENFQRRFDERCPNAKSVAAVLRHPTDRKMTKLALKRFLDAVFETCDYLLAPYIAFQELGYACIDGHWQQYRQARRFFRRHFPECPSLMGKRPASKKPKKPKSLERQAALHNAIAHYEVYLHKGVEYVQNVYNYGQVTEEDVEEVFQFTDEKMKMMKDHFLEEPEAVLAQIGRCPRFVRQHAVKSYKRLYKTQRGEMDAQMAARLDAIISA